MHNRPNGSVGALSAKDSIERVPTPIKIGVEHKTKQMRILAVAGFCGICTTLREEKRAKPISMGIAVTVGLSLFWNLHCCKRTAQQL